MKKVMGWVEFISVIILTILVALLVANELGYHPSGWFRRAVPDLPMEAELEEAPEADGYMRFLQGQVDGTVVVTHELRIEGVVRATQVYTIAAGGVSTDTVAPPLVCLPWCMPISGVAEIWAQGKLTILQENGETVTSDGVGYFDLDTPVMAVDGRGFYLMGYIENWKLFLPIYLKGAEL